MPGTPATPNEWPAPIPRTRCGGTGTSSSPAGPRSSSSCAGSGAGTSATRCARICGHSTATGSLSASNTSPMTRAASGTAAMATSCGSSTKTGSCGAGKPASTTFPSARPSGAFSAPGRRPNEGSRSRSADQPTNTLKASVAAQNASLSDGRPRSSAEHPICALDSRRQLSVHERTYRRAGARLFNAYHDAGVPAVRGQCRARPGYPKVRVVTVSECASHAVADAAMGGVAGKGAGEQSLARKLYRRLEEDWLLIADRNFFNWADWCTAADTGAQLLWRVKADLTLPVLDLLPDGSYSSVLVNPKIRGKARQALTEAARGREDLEEDQARYVRVIEYEVPDREGDGKGEVIALVTTITQMTAAPAPLLAQAYHQRWEHETGNKQLKTYLRGPGRVLRSESPDMVRQEIYGYLLTHYAISALICRAATEAGIDPDRVKFKRTVRIVRRRAADPAAFPP